MDNHEPETVAFYTRISTDEDHQKYSLGAQRERLEAFCTSQFGDEWKLFKVYRDTESGSHMDRPGLKELLDDVQARRFDTLLVFRVDRLSRKVRELAQMVDELTSHDIDLKSITEPFDTANAAGKMMLQMLGVFAEFEHATIVERTKVGMEKKAKTGEFVGGNVPYGYELDPEEGLVVNEEEAVIVRKMFKMYTCARQGASAICKDLNGEGCRNGNGRKWGRRSVLYMLKNPVYVGKIRWRDVEYEGQHDPIVSEVAFEKAQEILEKRNSQSPGKRWHNRERRLLTGVIRCARCKSHMFGGGGQKNGTHIPYYVCSKRFNKHECEQDYVRAETLEEAVIRDVTTILRDEPFLNRIRAEANRRLGEEKPDIDREIEKIEGELAEVQGKIERYLGAFEDGTLRPALCNEKLEDLNARVEELEDAKQGMEARRGRLELPAIDGEMMAALVENFEQVMADGTNPQKKHLLQQVVKKVLVHDRQTIEVWYCLPAPASGCEHWEGWLPGEDSNLQPSG
ncbi:MAG: recombinase family protein [Candidatus Brocadiia bacterium]